MSGLCPECEAAVPLTSQDIRGSVVDCPECGAELEVVKENPVTLELAPREEEDYGE